MATPLVVNGVTYQYPQQFDKNWAPILTAWSTAVTTGMLQKAGGTFTLTAETDFGGSFGLKCLYVKSKETNIASTGILRLANASSGVVWRNNVNGADLPLTVNSSNQLTFNGLAIGATTSLTDSHILVGNVSNQPADVAMSGDIAITNSGVTSIGAGKVLDVNIGATAAITLSKLASSTAYYWYVANASGVLTPKAVTASKVVITDANGLPSASSVTPTELGYVSGVTSPIQAQITAINSVPAGATMDFAGVIAPAGWLLCDGSTYATATYPALFSAIGYAWGGSGANFKVPSMARRTSIGAGGVGTGTIGNAVGDTGGGEATTHTHIENTHTHGIAHQHRQTIGHSGATVYTDATSPYGTVSFNHLIYNWAGTGGGPSPLGYDLTSGVLTSDSAGQSDAGMDTQSLTNMQPSAVFLKIIKY